MKSRLYLSALALAMASALLPQLEELATAFRWTRVQLSHWLCAKKLYASGQCQ